MTDVDDRSWLSDRNGLTILAALTVILAGLVVLPYLNYVLLAGVLAYILLPAQRQLERYLRATTAALSLVVVSILAILLPTLYLLAIAIREAHEIITAVQNGEIGPDAIESRLESMIGYSADLGELYAAYQEPIATGLQGLATGAIGLIGGLPELLIGLTVTVFVLFSLLRDGDRLVAWVRSVLPIRDDVQDELVTELDRLMWASVVGNVAVAAIQAFLLGVGLLIAGVPAVIFLTVTTFVLALLPLIGAFGVWLPVSIYLVGVGQPFAAAFIFVYGMLISASDMYLRPALIGRSPMFNASTVVVGIFGGIVVFGGVGLFVGPVILGGAKVTLDLFARERASSPTS